MTTRKLYLGIDCNGYHQKELALIFTDAQIYKHK